MKAVVIGSEGFIGRNIVARLLKEGYTVTGIDLTDAASGGYEYHKISRLSPDFTPFFLNHPFDYCINAAGSGSVPLSVNEPQRDYDANVNDTLQLLECIRLYNKGCKYLHISSAAVYGNPISLPVTEHMLPAPLSPYGYHKWISELLCREYAALFGIPTAIVRPFSVYGPGLRKQIIWDMYQKIKHNTTINLYGTGQESRDFIFIEDVAESFLLIMQKDSFTGNVFNIGTGNETTVQALANTFLKLTGHTCTISFNNQQRQGDPLNWKADIQKIRALGFKPKYTITEGLRITLHWLQTN